MFAWMALACVLADRVAERVGFRVGRAHLAALGAVVVAVVLVLVAWPRLGAKMNYGSVAFGPVRRFGPAIVRSLPERDGPWRVAGEGELATTLVLPGVLFYLMADGVRVSFPDLNVPEVGPRPRAAGRGAGGDHPGGQRGRRRSPAARLPTRVDLGSRPRPHPVPRLQPHDPAHQAGEAGCVSPGRAGGCGWLRNGSTSPLSWEHASFAPRSPPVHVNPGGAFTFTVYRAVISTLPDRPVGAQAKEGTASHP